VTGRLVDVRAPRLDAARMPKASPAAVQGTPRSQGAGLVAELPHTIDALASGVGLARGIDLAFATFTPEAAA
jgi:hypothetical protein